MLAAYKFVQKFFYKRVVQEINNKNRNNKNTNLIVYTNKLIST